MTTYAEACDTYATDQGLDPITAALAEQGVPHGVDQTGGFCMCVRVDLAEGGAHWLWMTSAREMHGEDTDDAVVGEYWDCEELYGRSYHSEGRDHGLVPLSDLRDLVTRVAREALDCPEGCATDS